MKAAVCLSMLLVLSSSPLLAQTATIKDIPRDGESTTVTVQKGKLKATASDEMLVGDAEIAGDPNVLVKAARESWKKACEDWKKEVKELNKTNDVLMLNCNAAKCEVENSQSLCKSTATYRIRLKLAN